MCEKLCFTHTHREKKNKQTLKWIWNKWITLLTNTFVNRLSNSIGSGMGCFDFALIVDCRMLACLGCNKFVGFDEETTLSGRCSEGVSSFEDSSPMINQSLNETTSQNTHNTTHKKKENAKKQPPVHCYSFSKRSNRWLKWRGDMLDICMETTCVTLHDCVCCWLLWFGSEVLEVLKVQSHARWLFRILVEFQCAAI